MRTFEENKRLYAQLMLKIGLNFQKGQVLILRSPIEAHDFVKILVQEAYKLGAKYIVYKWSSEELDKIRYENAQEEYFGEYPKWIVDGLTQEMYNNAAVITLYMNDPFLLKGINPEYIRKDKKAERLAMKDYKNFISGNGTNRLIVSVPTGGRANAVYGTKNTEENLQKLWNQIFSLVRIDKEDPFKEWEQHIEKLNKYARYLNEKKFLRLHYRSPKTDLIIELPKGHIWESAGGKNKKGISFCPNLPTEEVFSMPHKYGVNGKVTATFPLGYNGQLIKNFSLTFEDGAVVEYTAEEGYEALKSIIEMDENSKRLGEVAIVPVSSPIYQSGIVYFNTLFDENASCHLALGSAYESTIQGGDKMTKEERDQVGMNESITHVDFMVGDETLTITGETIQGEMIDFFVEGKRNIE